MGEARYGLNSRFQQPSSHSPRTGFLRCAPRMGRILAMNNLAYLDGRCSPASRGFHRTNVGGLCQPLAPRRKARYRVYASPRQPHGSRRIKGSGERERGNCSGPQPTSTCRSKSIQSNGCALTLHLVLTGDNITECKARQGNLNLKLSLPARTTTTAQCDAWLVYHCRSGSRYPLPVGPGTR